MICHKIVKNTLIFHWFHFRLWEERWIFFLNMSSVNNTRRLNMRFLLCKQVQTSGHSPEDVFLCPLRQSPTQFTRGGWNSSSCVINIHHWNHAPNNKNSRQNLRQLYIGCVLQMETIVSEWTSKAKDQISHCEKVKQENFPSLRVLRLSESRKNPILPLQI